MLLLDSMLSLEITTVRAATGIVNGSYGCIRIRSLTWHDDDEMNEIPQGKPGELIEVPVPKTVNVYFKDKVVPVASFCETTTKQNSHSSVYLQRNRHQQVDIGFAVTYHKIIIRTQNISKTEASQGSDEWRGQHQ